MQPDRARSDNHVEAGMSFLPLLGKSSLPTSWIGNGANPEGILQQSPGLRGTSYPGSIASGRANLNGVASVGGERGHNPVGVETWFARFPRVAPPLFLGRDINSTVGYFELLGCANGEGLSERAESQPWAGGRNPFGIGRDGIPGLWVMPLLGKRAEVRASVLLPFSE